MRTACSLEKLEFQVKVRNYPLVASTFFSTNNSLDIATIIDKLYRKESDFQTYQILKYLIFAAKSIHLLQRLVYFLLQEDLSVHTLHPFAKINTFRISVVRTS